MSTIESEDIRIVVGMVTQGLAALRLKSQPQYRLATLEWFSVPSAKPQGIKDNKGVKVLQVSLANTAKLRDELEIIFVQPSGAIPITADKVEKDTLTFSAAAWNASGIVPEELGKTLIAYPRTFYALPKDLLGEQFDQRLDEIEIQINDIVIAQLEKVKKGNLQEAEQLLEAIDAARDDEAKMSALLTPETIAKVEELGALRQNGDESPLRRRLLEAHFGMPDGHLSHMPAFLVNDLYDEVDRAKAAVNAIQGYKDLSPEPDTTEDDEEPAKKASSSGRKRTAKR